MTVERSLGDGDLKLFQPGLPLLRGLLGHALAHPIRRGLLLPRIGECSHPLQGGARLEIEEEPEVLLRFPGKAHEERRPDRRPGHRFPDLIDQGEILLRLPPPPHGPQDSGRGMLQGNIEVGKKTGILLEDGEDLPREMVGMDVEHANPEVSRQAGDLSKKKGELRRPPVHAVRAEILGYENDLPDPSGKQVADLPQHILAGPAGEPPPDEGYGTVGTPVVAAIRHLHVCASREGKQSRAERRGHRQGSVSAASIPSPRGKQRRNAGRIPVSPDAVYLGKLPGKLLTVALREASRHVDSLPGESRAELEPRLDGFGLGLGNETARIDDQHIRFFGAGDEAPSRPLESGDHELGVDLVFRAAETLYVEGSGSRHRGCWRNLLS